MTKEIQTDPDTRRRDEQKWVAMRIVGPVLFLVAFLGYRELRDRVSTEWRNVVPLAFAIGVLAINFAVMRVLDRKRIANLSAVERDDRRRWFVFALIALAAIPALWVLNLVSPQAGPIAVGFVLPAFLIGALLFAFRDKTRA